MKKTINNKVKIHIVKLGCDKNDVDAEIMGGLLLKSNFDITTEAEEADVIIINTCGFINSAKQESIDYILDAIEYKKNGSCHKVIVSGCLAQRYANELAKELTEVDAFVGVGDIDKISNIIKDVQNNKNDKIYCSDPQLSDRFAERIVSQGDVTAYVKIAEGCDSFCSYCVIPMLRGRYQSRTVESILNEVKKLAQSGIKEINLVAQNTTAYGVDLWGEPKLVDLLKRLLEIKEIRWFRLLYCYQDNITNELLHLISSEERIASYLDIPIQHSHPQVLKNMNRNAIDKVNVDWFYDLQRRVPNITLRTTVMVGFPGETDEQFNHLVNFINEVKFNHLGVFCFSAEEGTRAYSMKNQVDTQTSLDRYNAIKDEQLYIALNKKRELLKRQLPILLLEQDGDLWLGRGEGDAPEIDNICYVANVVNAKKGDVIIVQIDEIDFDYLKGRMLHIEKRA